MKQWKQLYREKAARHWTVWLLLLPILFACGGENNHQSELPDQPEMCKVLIMLQAPQGMNPMTKVEGIPSWQPDELYERTMQEWLVVAYNSQGAYAAHVVGGGSFAPDPDFEAAAQLELLQGSYTFYAFANLSTLENGAELLRQITSARVSEAEMKQLVAQIDIRQSIQTAGKYIPMSSYGYPFEVKVSGTLQPSIPLIRMIGKAQISITNNRGNDMTLTALEIGSIRSRGGLFLSPWGENRYLEFAAPAAPNIEKVPQFPPSTSAVAKMFYPFELTASNRTIANTQKQDYYCYVDETYYQGEDIQIRMQMNNQTIEKRTDFSSIRRNDWLQIPIMFADIETTIAFKEQRLPIGVYPTEVTFGASDGVQLLTPHRYHLKSAGDLHIQYRLKHISSVSQFQIKYYQAGGTITGGEKFSSIQLIDNGSGLLIDRTTHQALEKELLVDYSKPVIPFSQTLPTEGSFVIRSQELGRVSSATLVLTLVVTYTAADGTHRHIEIPYTIQITNAPKPSVVSGSIRKGGDVK